MYSEQNQERPKSERPFEPTSIELRKQYNTLDSLIRVRSNELKETGNQQSVPNQNTNDTDNDGFLPPFNSAF